MMDKVANKKKPVYKRAWFWLLLSPVMFMALLVLTAIIIGLSGGFDEEMEVGEEVATQLSTEEVRSTSTPIPLSTATSTTAPTKALKLIPRPTLIPTIAPIKSPKPTPTQTPKPTIKPTPTTRPTPTPSPTLDPAEAPYGVDINGNPGPDFVTLIVDFENALETMMSQDVEISTLEDDWYVYKTNFRYNLTTDCKIDKSTHEVIMKIEYDETYETFKVFQLKIDGVNIDF